MNKEKTVLVLFEYSGVFTNLYKELGFNVIQIDIELGTNIHDFDYKALENVEIILSFPPCTEFTRTGSRWWEQKAKESPHLLTDALKNVHKVLEIVEYHKPKIWFIENPIGRIETCVPILGAFQKIIFNPCDFAAYNDKNSDECRYTKQTVLYGCFNVPIRKHLGALPELKDKIYSPKDENGKKLKWNSEESKKIRNLTPYGFAKAFVLFNNVIENCKQDIEFKNMDVDFDIVRMSLKSVFEECKLSTFEICAKTKLSNTEISNFKKGKRSVSIEKALTICHCIGLSELFLKRFNELSLKYLQLLT